LGSVELSVAELAEESEDIAYPFKSKGKKEAVDPLRLDKGNTYKGDLHYTAEFIPAMKLKGIEFHQEETSLDKAPEQNEDGGDVASSASNSSVDLTLPDGPTFRLEDEKKKHRKGHKKNAKSTDTMRTVDTTHTTDTTGTTGTAGTANTSGSAGTGVTGQTAESGKKEDEGVELTHDELITNRTSFLRY
jgi:hypothetical protein